MPKAKARAAKRAQAAPKTEAYVPNPRGPFGAASPAAFSKLVEYVNRGGSVSEGKIVIETAKGECGDMLKKIITSGLTRMRLKTADVKGGHAELLTNLDLGLKPLIEGFYLSRVAAHKARFGDEPAGAVVLEFNHVPIENVMLEEQVAGLERGWFSMHYFDIPMLQKYFAQRWAGEDAGLTEEQGGELAGELNGCIKLAHEDGKMLVLNAFRSNGTPLAGQPQTVSFNMVPVMMQLAATAEEKTKVLSAQQYNELRTAAGIKECQAMEFQLPDGGARFYDFNAATSMRGAGGAKAGPSIFAQVTPEQQHTALTRFVTNNMRIIGTYAAQQSAKHGAGAMFLFSKAAFDDLISINPSFDWTGAGPGGWSGEGEQPENSGCKLDRQYLLAWGVDDSHRDEDLQPGQFTAEELSVDMRQFTKSLKKSIDDGESDSVFPLVLCADPSGEATPDQFHGLLSNVAAGVYPADAPLGETCAVVIGALAYPIDKESKRKQVEHAVAAAKAKAEGKEPPAPLAQLSPRDQLLATMEANKKGVDTHSLSYFMDRPE